MLIILLARNYFPIRNKIRYTKVYSYFFKQILIKLMSLITGPLGKLKILVKSPMMLFVYGILSKWYITIIVTAIVVTFWVFKGLSDNGILQASQDVVFKALNETKSVARYCIPKIISFSDFWDCLQNPPEYEPTAEEATIESNVKFLVDPSGYDERKDPYAN